VRGACSVSGPRGQSPGARLDVMRLPDGGWHRACRGAGPARYSRCADAGEQAEALLRLAARLGVVRDEGLPVGAATSVLLAASPLLDKVGGRYFEDGNEAAVVTRRPAGYAGVALSPGHVHVQFRISGMSWPCLLM